jgi:hypothetical protein
MSIRQFLAATLAFALCGAPQLTEAQQPQSSNPSPNPSSAAAADAQAQQPASTQATTQTQTQTQTEEPPPAPQPNGASQIKGVSVDPSQGPLQPVAPENQSQPQAPATAPADSSSQAQQPNSQPQTQSLPDSPEPQKPSEPVGAAAAQQGRTAGGAASKPAGMAIAPAKQSQVRSWLIRLGAIAAAGAAVGTVYALSRGTPSNPPGAHVAH